MILQRIIKVEILLSDNPEQSSAPNRHITLEGHRVTCDITVNAGETKGVASIKIYGLSITDMNNMTVIGSTITAHRQGNLIKISAGSGQGNMVQVYEGNIDTAYADFNSAPDVPLVITAMTGLDLAFKKYLATSPEQPNVSVSGMMKTFARDAALDFMDGGVIGVIDYPSYSGSLFSQFRNLARDANINAIIDNGFLKISPIFGAFNNGKEPVLITPQNGMVGYPTLSESAVTIKTLFNPKINQGDVIEVKDSIVKSANRKWAVALLSHEIDSFMPNGRWFTIIKVNEYAR
jgi:hypothetical protein